MDPVMQFVEPNPTFDSLWMNAGVSLGHDAYTQSVSAAVAVQQQVASAASAAFHHQYSQQQQHTSKRMRLEPHSQHLHLQMQLHQQQQHEVTQQLLLQQQQQQQQQQHQQLLLQQQHQNQQFISPPSYAAHGSSSSGDTSSPNNSWSDGSSEPASSGAHPSAHESSPLTHDSSPLITSTAAAGRGGAAAAAAASGRGRRGRRGGGAQSSAPASPYADLPLSTANPPALTAASSPSHRSSSSSSSRSKASTATSAAATKQDVAIRWAEYTPTTTGLHATFAGSTAAPVLLTCAVDKGFKSTKAEGIICQKKNHFQVSVVIHAPELPTYVESVASRTASVGDGSQYTTAEHGDTHEKVVDFVVDLNGVKTENHGKNVKLEQSSTDRLKRPYVPVHLDLDSAASSGGEGKSSSKSSATMLDIGMDPATDLLWGDRGFKKQVTVGRLHFNETTANNMRKRGKPNPEQRHFALVVKVMAKTDKGNLYPVAAMISEKLIVRASNPGHFEQESPAPIWSKGQSSKSLYHIGFVGINTAAPTEALSVAGNIKVTGTILQPSDKRVKTDITPVDTAQQLANIQRLPLYTYQLRPEWAASVNLAGAPTQCGVLAQELQQVLPTAVRAEAGSRTLADGSIIDNLLTVDKERLHMETLGAVKALASKTERLEQMVAQQEQLAAALTAELDEVVAATAAAQRRGLNDERLNGVANWASSMAAVVQVNVKELAGKLPALAAAFALVNL